MRPIRAGFKAQLEAGCEVADHKVQGLSVNLLQVEECLWVFASAELKEGQAGQIEPPHNAAERALRPAVIWRKTCFGVQSEVGARFVERVLTVEASCRRQGRNFVEYLSETLSARWSGQPSPSLF